MLRVADKHISCVLFVVNITSAHDCKPGEIVLENLIIYPIIKSQ